jgi:transcriptional regulator with XRE-family HTH domain
MENAWRDSENDTEEQRRLAFGRFLRTQREARKWTQEEVAHLVGISQAYVGQWEAGEPKRYTPSDLRAWASAFGLPVSRVLMEAGFITHADCAQIAAEFATRQPDDPVQIIEQIAALTDRLDRVMRADRESRERRQNAAS